MGALLGSSWDLLGPGLNRNSCLRGQIKTIEGPIHALEVQSQAPAGLSRAARGFKAWFGPPGAWPWSPRGLVLTSKGRHGWMDGWTDRQKIPLYSIALCPLWASAQKKEDTSNHQSFVRIQNLKSDMEVTERKQHEILTSIGIFQNTGKGTRT